jgi:protein-tyrosine phosphatase
MEPIKILFVCAGNICRSPLAEGVFRHLATTTGRAARFEIDSAGIGGWHRGEPPDRRSVAVAAENGFDISGQRARQVIIEDFSRFDLILAMDHDNLRHLKALAPPAATGKVHLFSAITAKTDEAVPDPYYGGKRDFVAVYTMLFAGCTMLLETIGNPLPS